MYSVFEKRLAAIVSAGGQQYLCEGLTGLEKESLRVSTDGTLSQKPHPQAFGSALTSPAITTDYSEALLEFITPPFEQAVDTLSYLKDVQQYIYKNLGEEILWATSMPCVVAGETSIPLAKYGNSNLGQMKTIYRRGLGHRYGRVMQVIAGVHYNFSFSDNFWKTYQQVENDTSAHQDFISARYFDLLRNLQRYGWLISYLFGSSPAICKSFLNGQQTSLHEFNENTYYEPYATSLRLGEIGYRNSREKEVGIKANYNSLDEYVASLKCAIETPCAEYEKTGIKVNGVYQQLNSNILQIENEYYSSVRPKQILRGNEKPIMALGKRGVRYVELRSLDVNAFEPLGMNEDTLHFLEMFLTFCLLHQSPPLSQHEREVIDDNLLTTAHRGREPGLKLKTCKRDQNTSERELVTWAEELLTKMSPIAELMDKQRGGNIFRYALGVQLESVRDPDKTPSGRMLNEMREHNEGFYHFARRMSLAHQHYFETLTVNNEMQQAFKTMAEESLVAQQQIEQADEISFDQFLAEYQAQQ